MSFFEKDDCVVVSVLKESRDQGYNPAPDGTRGTIIGFAEIAYEYIHNFGMKPGMYLNTSWPYVKLTTGEIINISSCHIKHAMDGLIKRRREAYCQLSDDERRTIEEERRVGDLPETRFWPGDVVKYDKYYGDYERLFVQRVDYRMMNEKCNDGSPYPFYSISHSFPDGGYMAVKEEELKLVERGNVWKYYHGEPLEFGDLEEEGRFFMVIGHTQEVRNPNNNLYKWELEEALQAIRDGLADAITVANNMFAPNSPITCVIKYDDRDLGRRIAEMTLQGFADQ